MFSGATLVLNVAIFIVAESVLILVAYLFAMLTDRNPLPFPHGDYHVFSASSPAALAALERLMQNHGHRPRFRIDSENVERTVFGNGTITNCSRHEMSALLGNPGGGEAARLVSSQVDSGE